MKHSILLLLLVLVPFSAAQGPADYHAYLESDEEGYPDGDVGAQTGYGCGGYYPKPTGSASASVAGQQASVGAATIMVVCGSEADASFDTGAPDPSQGPQLGLFVGICDAPSPPGDCIPILEYTPENGF